MPEQIYKFEPSEVWFTSDTHFGQENIIRYCGRPFRNAEEMNAELIRRWRETLPEDGIVFHLGDFAHGGSRLWNDILHALTGRKIIFMDEGTPIGHAELNRLREVATDIIVLVPIDTSPVKEVIAQRVSLLTGNIRYVYIGSRQLEDFRYVPVDAEANITKADVEKAIKIL